MKPLLACQILVLLFSLSVARGDDGTDLAKEIIDTQEEFLSAITPRPTGNDLKKSPLYSELVRRISLINKNWIHQQKGSKDAGEGKLAVIQLPNRSDVDKAYIALLERELGVELRTPPDGLKGDAARFYAYGFNTKQLEVLMQKIGEPTLEKLVYKACVSLNYKSTSSSSLFFVPWRFSKDFKHTIQGLKEIPHSR